MKNHYYISIPVYGHRVFKYAGEVPLGMESEYTEAFKRFGLTGLPGLPGPDEQDGPYDVLVLPSHKGDQVDEMGMEYPERYTPKQIVLTKRVRQTSTCTGGIHRQLWIKKSCRNSEDRGVQFAQTYGYMLHYFAVNEEFAWEKAVERHRDIEEARNELNIKMETVCPLPARV